VHVWAPAAGAVVGVVDEGEPFDATVVVVAAAAAPAAVVGAVDDGAVVESAVVVSVVPVLWALTECRVRTVRAAMAPPVVTAVPRAATNALFLMGSRLGHGGQMPLGVSSDGAPNS